MKNNKKIFVLGLGCQRSGTSWLYNYLSKSKNFQKGFTKEYHIWDCIDIEIQKQKLIRGFSISEFRSDYSKSIKLFIMRNYNNYYFNYFNSLYSKDKQVTADITPIYSGLSSKRLLMIDNRFKEFGIEVKPIIIFRDPVDRIKSVTKKRIVKKKKSKIFSEKEFVDEFNNYYNTEQCKLRSTYTSILKATKEVFKDRFKVMFFENMFTEKGAREISDYCETDYMPELIDKKINQFGDKYWFNTTFLNDKVFTFYKNEYKYFNENYPETLKLWKS